LYDLERVEYCVGRKELSTVETATGGNLNIITATPKSAFDANFDVSYGNFNEVTGHAMLNAPVSDTLAVRAGGWWFTAPMAISPTQGYRPVKTTAPLKDTGVGLTGFVDAGGEFQMAAVFRWL